jgi:TRAP-type C4-dicarboxylate transport system permease small subunit
VNSFEKILQSVTEKMAMVAQGAIVACMVLVVVEAIKRAVVVGGIRGSSEIVEMLAAIILSMGIGYLTFVKGHVAVGLIVDRFRPRTQAVFDIVTSAISLGFTIWLTQAMANFGLSKLKDGLETGTLQVPLYPFCFVITFALALTCVVLIRDLLKAVIVLRRGSKA